MAWPDLNIPQASHRLVETIFLSCEVGERDIRENDLALKPLISYKVNPFMSFTLAVSTIGMRWSTIRMMTHTSISAGRNGGDSTS